MERDNKDQKLIKLEWVRGAEMLVEEENLKERIKRAQKGDKKVVKAVEELKKAEIKMLRDKEWEIENCGKDNKFRGESSLRVLWLKVKRIFF